MKRWSHRCATCGNPRHFLPFYIRGWLAWHLLVRWLPVQWCPNWLFAVVGDWAHDHRACAWSCGPDTVEDAVVTGGKAAA